MTVNPQNSNNSGAGSSNNSSGRCSDITGTSSGGPGPTNCGSSGSFNTNSGPLFPSPANANYPRANNNNGNVWQLGRPTRWRAFGGMTAPAMGLREALRARLLAALAQRGATPEDEEPQPEAVRDEAAPDAPPPQQEANAPTPAPPADYDEAYCSYMASQVVRGELTPGGGTPIPAGCNAAIAAAQAQRNNEPPPFSMSPVDTRREMDRLEQAPTQQPADQQ